MILWDSRVIHCNSPATTVPYSDCNTTYHGLWVQLIGDITQHRQGPFPGMDQFCLPEGLLPMSAWLPLRACHSGWSTSANKRFLMVTQAPTGQRSAILKVNLYLLSHAPTEPILRHKAFDKPVPLCLSLSHTHTHACGSVINLSLSLSLSARFPSSGMKCWCSLFFSFL